MVITITRDATMLLHRQRLVKNRKERTAHHNYHKVFMLVLEKENILPDAGHDYINHSKKIGGSERNSLARVVR